MDYESEQLDAYETADAERFLLGSVKKPEPEQKFDPTLGYDKDELKSIFGGAAEEVGKRTIGGMARDAAQSIMDTGADLLTAAGEDFLEQSGFARADGSNIRLNVPAPQLPEIAEPESLIGQIARDFGQFAIVYGLSPAKLGIVGRAAVADAAFDPVKDGSLGMIQGLINAGALTEAMQFLAVEPTEESTAQERLMGRLNQAAEGAVIGAAADGLIRTLKAIKNNPKALRAFATGFISATGASISPEAAQGLPLKRIIQSVAKTADSLDNAAPNPNRATGDAFADAQARYFETGKFEPPTAENPVSVVLPTETEPGIIAFHGSGADFDEFRLEMIGTGEGAQAYGYGLYFTDSEDIAKFYRETVGKRKQGLPTSIPDDPNDVAGALAQDIGFKEGVFGDTGLLQINSGDPDYDFFIKMLDDNAVETTQAGVAKTYEFNDGSVITLSDEATPVFKGKALDTVYTSDVEYMFESEIQDILKRAQEMGMPGDRASLRNDIVTVLSQLGQGLGSKRDMYTAVESLAPSYGGPPSRYMTIYNQFIEPNTDIQTVSTLTELGSKRGKIYKVGLSPKPDELLDYDKSLRQQPKFADALKPIYEEYGVAETADIGTLFETIKNRRGMGKDPVAMTVHSAQSLSERLSAAGIPGIKYRAAGSRGAGVTDEAAERNYVIFDDKAVKILEKYGIAGPVGVTAVTASGVQEKNNDDQNAQLGLFD